jgi:23S rRNA pseudouridine2605 synthase
MIGRLQKLMADRGVASRRACEQMILQGRVTVNGETARLGQSADGDLDEILLDGRPLPAAGEKLYIMLNKPRGYVTTLHDEHGRKTVAALVADCGDRVYPVGRLDYDSEGLLLMTNDGALTNTLTHPSFEREKVYQVTVRGDLEAALERLGEPMTIDGYRIRPAVVTLLSSEGNRGKVRITIHEGKNRQIRKMCEQCDLEVLRLVRVEQDGLRLGNLRPGKWRFLTPEEIASLRRKP